MALKGIKVLEMGGLAPGPMTGMILADFGASVIRIDKTGGSLASSQDCLCRGKRSIVLNLKKKQGAEIVKKLAEKSDVLIEPFRPGVMERLGLGPDVLLNLNRKLVYARLSGYGQTGPMSLNAGHDINYLATSGVLSRLRWSGQKPCPPINLIADFAGGGLFCAFAVSMALLNLQKTGKGEVIDLSLTEGAAYVSSWLFRSQNSYFTWPSWSEVGSNLLDGGFPLYDTYETKDGKFMAVGALEPEFQKAFLEMFNVGLDSFSLLGDKEEGRKKIAEKFLTMSQEDWTAFFKDCPNACVTPVLSMEEVGSNSQHTSRGAFFKGEFDMDVPKPLPCSVNLTSDMKGKEPRPGEHSKQILSSELLLSDMQIEDLIKEGVIEVASSSKL